MRPACKVGALVVALAAAAPAWGQTVRVQGKPGGGNVRAAPPASVDFSGSRRPGARLPPGLSWGPGIGSPGVNFRPGLSSVELPPGVVPRDGQAAPDPSARPSFERPYAQPGNAEAFGAFEAFGEFSQSLPSGDARSGQAVSGWPLDDRDFSPAAGESPSGNPARGSAGRSALLRRELSLARPVEEIEVEKAGIFGRRLADIMSGDLPAGAVAGRDHGSFRSENFSPFSVGPSGLSVYEARSPNPEAAGAFGASVPGPIEAFQPGGETHAPIAPAPFKGPVKLLVMKAAKLGFLLSEKNSRGPERAAGTQEPGRESRADAVVEPANPDKFAAVALGRGRPAADAAAEIAMAELVRRPPYAIGMEEAIAYSASAAGELSAFTAARPLSSRRSSSMKLPSPTFPLGSTTRASRLRLHPAAPAGLLLLGLAPLLSLSFKRD